MLESLKTLGELYGTFKPYDEISADYVLVLNLDSQGNFLDFELEEFSEEKSDKYLYRTSGTSNPPSWTPTMNLNIKNPEKTLKLTLNQLQKLTDLGNLKLENLPNLRKDIENLTKQIKELLKDLPKKAKVLFTVKIDGKYIGEIEQLVEGLKALEKTNF
jgi:CRISPR-associated protein Csh1